MRSYTGDTISALSSHNQRSSLNKLVRLVGYSKGYFVLASAFCRRSFTSQ
jgi:hypothetical protein